MSDTGKPIRRLKADEAKLFQRLAFFEVFHRYRRGAVNAGGVTIYVNEAKGEIVR